MLYKYTEAKFIIRGNCSFNLYGFRLVNNLAIIKVVKNFSFLIFILVLLQSIPLISPI